MNYLKVYCSNRQEQNFTEFLIYRTAIECKFWEGEPKEVTQARETLHSAIKTAYYFNDLGLVPPVEPPIFYALTVGGYLQGETNAS